MRMLLLIFFLSSSSALHCDKVFNYYDSYGNGFDIKCQGITTSFIHILQNITISQEISLTIENSTITNVNPELFRRVSNIRYLFIYDSIFTFHEDERIFKYLNHLEQLVIGNTVFSVNKYTFTGLDRLNELTLSNNSLSNIEEGSFKHLSNLRKLQITLNKLKDIQNIPLCEVRDIECLNVSRNHIRALKLLNFHCKRISEPLDITFNNQNHTLNVLHDFQNVLNYGLGITHIDLSHNRINAMDDVLVNLKFVRILKLQGNFLSQLKNADLAHLNDLEQIYLQNNDLKLIEDNVFDDKVELQHIDVSNNKLRRFNINELPLLDFLNLGFNELSNFTINSIKTMKSLRFLILNNNNFTVFEEHAFQWYTSLELLDLANNKIVLKEQSLNGLTMLKTLNLSNNSIEELYSNVFSSLTHLTALDLSCNKLHSLTFNKTFQYLSSLEILNISYNLIENLDYDIFKTLGSLRVLDLSGNKLREIQYELILTNLKLLSVLDIKSNLLSCEMLESIIRYLKMKKVTYTLLKKNDYERENIGGIYCTSQESSLKIVKVSNNSNILINLSIVLSIVFTVIVIFMAIFRIYIYLKRRQYRPDEFELINE